MAGQKNRILSIVAGNSYFHAENHKLSIYSYYQVYKHLLGQFSICQSFIKSGNFEPTL